MHHHPLPLEEGLGLGRLGRLLFDSVQVRHTHMHVSSSGRKWRRTVDFRWDKSMYTCGITHKRSHPHMYILILSHFKLKKNNAQGTYWLFAERALFQMALAREEEGRFVWRLYLEKALQVGG